MAVHKATRSNPLAQPRSQQPKSTRRHPDHHQKAELLDTLRQLNRGYGIAAAALHRLQRPGIFPADCLRDYRDRTEALRALANRDLFRLLSGHEEKDAARFNNSTKARAKRSVVGQFTKLTH
jgi:hypothetical protein